MFTPFDFNEAVGHRKDYIDERLREGSPVVGLAYEGGLMLLTVRRNQRKVYEIYDRQMFAAIGYQSDIENVRLASIQMAHQEGFERSPDDVSVQRLVGFSLSPALKKAFGDQFSGMPFVIRALFAELGRTPGTDLFCVLGYDGEYRQYPGAAAIAGTQMAEDRMLEQIGEPNLAWTREEALQKALAAWTIGARTSFKRSAIGQKEDEEEFNPLRGIDEADADRVFLHDELKTGTLEVGLLERRTHRESRFRLLTPADLEPLVRDY
jgi:proteasome alpha subunit